MFKHAKKSEIFGTTKNPVFRGKRGMELTTNTIILLVIAVLVLVIIVLFATGAFGSMGNQIIGKIKWAFGLWPKSPTG